MKKLFSLIGIIIGIFAAFFTVLMSFYTPFIEAKDQYRYSCDTPISTSILFELAQKADVQIQIKNFVETGIFDSKINVLLLNSSKNTKLGIQPSLLPWSEVTFIEGENLPEIISSFIIEENYVNKLELFNQELLKYNIKYDVDITEYTYLLEQLILSPFVYIIMGLLFIVIIFCIISYFISRSNEIAILKLNGWNNLRISIRLINQISTITILSAAIVMSIFGIYIFVMDSSQLVEYFELCLFLLCVVYLIFVLASLIAIFFIERMDKTVAMKKGKNTKAILYLFIISKLILTIIFFIGFNSSINQFIDCIDALEHGEEINKRGLYYIHVSDWPYEKVEEKINKYLSSIPDEEIFNYIPSDSSTFKKREIERGDVGLTSIKDFIDINKTPNFLIMSNNTLNYFDIATPNGEKVDFNSQFGVLIPNHLKKDESKIISKLLEGAGMKKEKFKIIYIQDGQSINSLMFSNDVYYDSIIMVTPTNKTLSDDFYFTEKTAIKIEKELQRLGIPLSEIYIAKLSDKSNLCIQVDISNSYLFLFVLILSLLSYLLSAIAVFTVNFEVKKKAFGVYALLGEKPYGLCINVILINTIIISSIVIFINKLFLLWVAVEAILFIILNIRYMKNKAILEIKGE